MNPVGAFDQGQAFPGAPGEPHAKNAFVLEHGDVEAGAQAAPEHGLVGVLEPAGAGFYGILPKGQARRQPQPTRQGNLGELRREHE